MIGTKIYKDDKFDTDLYHKCAAWCNSTQQGIIEKREDYFEVVANPYYESPETKALRAELTTLQKYLDSTDWMVTKCFERGLSMASEYPEAYEKRQEARERIDAVRTELGE